MKLREGDRVINLRRPSAGSGTVTDASEGYLQMGIAIVRWDLTWWKRTAENSGDLKKASPLEELAHAAPRCYRLVRIPPC